jgi:hypothetical protein
MFSQLLNFLAYSLLKEIFCSEVLDYLFKYDPRATFNIGLLLNFIILTYYRFNSVDEKNILIVQAHLNNFFVVDLSIA